VQLFLLAYPWDVADEGLGPRLDRLRGEVGVTGLSLWAAAPPVAELRARDVAPRVFCSHGGVLFQPSDRLYVNLRAQPIVSTWLRNSNPIKQVAEACAARDIKLRAVISASATGRLAERYPEFACRNLFGGESQHRVCLGSADVQSLLGALIADLTAQCELSAVVLTDFAITWPDMLNGCFQAGPLLGPVEQSLLGACFCPACQRNSHEGGVDAAAAKRTATQFLQQFLDDGGRWEKPLDEFLAQHPAVTAYRRSQMQILNNFLRKLNDACRCGIILDGGGSEGRGAVAPDPAIAAGFITPVERAEQHAIAARSAGSRGEIRLPAWWAMPARGPQLVGLLPEAARQGVAGVTIDHYGILPDTALTTLRQAIRFTRRSVSG
jgi:hypothetical protein